MTEEIAQGLIAFLSGETDRDMRASRFKRTIKNLAATLRLHPG